MPTIPPISVSADRVASMLRDFTPRALLNGFVTGRGDADTFTPESIEMVMTPRVSQTVSEVLLFLSVYRKKRIRNA
jgi:hypothetical protein